MHTEVKTSLNNFSLRAKAAGSVLGSLFTIGSVSTISSLLTVIGLLCSLITISIILSSDHKMWKRKQWEKEQRCSCDSWMVMLRQEQETQKHELWQVVYFCVSCSCLSWPHTFKALQKYFNFPPSCIYIFLIQQGNICMPRKVKHSRDYLNNLEQDTTVAVAGTGIIPTKYGKVSSK